MPERKVSFENLRTGAFLGGWILTGWAILVTFISLSDHTKVGAEIVRMGFPWWTVLILLVCVVTLQLWGHCGNFWTILVAGDLLGGLSCFMAASILGHAAVHGADTGLSAANWAFVGTNFLLHTVMLRQKIHLVESE